MAELRIRMRSIDLVDVLLHSDDAYRVRFHDDGDVQPVAVAESVLRLVEDYLDLDLTGDLVNLERYVVSGLRDKTRPPSGNRLGDLMEGLTWLLFHRQSRELVRVVGTEPPSFKKKQLPRPDFIEREATGHIRLVEVKSTDALSAEDLRPGAAGTRPCAAARASAADALDQLGMDPALEPLVTPSTGYRLRLRADDERPPFPGDAATAVVWLARDKRLDGRGLAGVEGTLGCRTKGWGCVDCLGSASAPAHLSMVEMPNAPGLVPMWPGRGDVGGWWQAYRHWERADWLGHSEWLTATADELWRETEHWSRWSGARDVLDWWRHHLSARVARAGMRNLDKPWFDVEQVATVPADEQLAYWEDLSISLDGLEPIGLEGDGPGPWTLRVASGQLDLRLHTGERIADARSAEALAIKLVNTLLQVEGRRQEVDALPLRQVSFGEVLLGWEVPPSPDFARDRSFLRRPPPWYMALWYGACRSRLTVLPDGSARLTATLNRNQE